MQTYNQEMKCLKYKIKDFNAAFAVILDRDGTLNEDEGYTYKAEDLKILPNVIESLEILSKAGGEFFIASNQSGIGRGLFTILEMEEFNFRLISTLKKQGIYVCGIYICPHQPSDKTYCFCRKPAPGLLNEILVDFDLPKMKTFMIGNSQVDVEAAKNAKISGFRINNSAEWIPVIRKIQEKVC
jgi:histidinol-phosphate phosphatase family protein